MKETNMITFVTIDEQGNKEKDVVYDRDMTGVARALMSYKPKKGRLIDHIVIEPTFILF